MSGLIEKNFFDHLVKNDTRTDENIRKIATVQGDDYTTGCLLDNVRIRAKFFC